ncbi:hypothetical protein BGC33_08740 [Bathymodiolus thermophilus thioautotrophic gill symbiont]|uniref:Uncharacterized protein n=1 Tax=Bathymodiolus thermophilus thioautotrophic gill symbiont TaxID=2360 RepID=A0A1J5U553_9GAMM|nr:hypothetical protein BGC33_08740 [Bathymodiolus thermophilus thioautotrophic gill symbiont]
MLVIFLTFFLLSLIVGKFVLIVQQKTIKKISIIRDLCINMNNHQESLFHPLGNFLNPALALLGQGLRKLPSG